MADRRDALILLGTGVLAAAAGLYFGPRLTGSVHPSDPESLRTARFVDLTGKSRSIEEWKGQFLVLNFWATWCPPCREEIPALSRVRNKLLRSGVEFLGIAIDNAAKVSEFAKEMAIPYPILLADASGLDLMRKLGNPAGALPFTIVLDRTGMVVVQHLGALTEQKMQDLLAPLLAG